MWQFSRNVPDDARYLSLAQSHPFDRAKGAGRQFARLLED